ncbi:MAG: restriction endonuclease [Planctomycetota bacterium]
MKSKEYEQFIKQVISTLIPNDLTNPPPIEHLKKYTGKSGVVYKIDLSYKFQVADTDYLTLIECKHWNQRVKRSVVSELKDKVEDIGAHKGVIVTTIGFQQGALKLAGKNGIALAKSTDSGKLDIIKSLLGESEITANFITSNSACYQGGEFNEVRGVVGMKTHILDYIVMHYGVEVAAFLGSKEIMPISQMKPSEIKSKIIEQLRKMGKEWIYDYLKIESCGMPITVEPEMYLRAINAKSICAMMEIGKGDMGKSSDVTPNPEQK